MQQFIEKYRDQITGVLSGFDRLVFRGTLRRLNYGGAGDGAISLAEPGFVQGLPAACEAVESAGERRDSQAVSTAGAASDVSARFQGGQRRTGARDRGRARSEQRTGACDQHAGAGSDLRAPRHAYHRANTALRRALPVSDPSRGGMVSLQYPGGAERTGRGAPGPVTARRRDRSS